MDEENTNSVAVIDIDDNSQTTEEGKETFAQQCKRRQQELLTHGILSMIQVAKKMVERLPESIANVLDKLENPADYEEEIRQAVEELHSVFRDQLVTSLRFHHHGKNTKNVEDADFVVVDGGEVNEHKSD